MVQPLWKTACRFHKKLKIQLPYASAIPLLGMDLKKTKTFIWKGTCVFMFITVLFIVSKM